jgi:hypothetical protein
LRVKEMDIGPPARGGVTKDILHLTAFYEKSYWAVARRGFRGQGLDWL